MARQGEGLTAEEQQARADRIEGWVAEGKGPTEIAKLETAAGGVAEDGTPLRPVTKQRIAFLIARGPAKAAEGRPRKAPAEAGA